MTRLRTRTVVRRTDNRPFETMGQTPMPHVDKIPVGDGMVECPSCGGGVYLTKATFTDADMGIYAKRTLLYRNHGLGGRKSPGVTKRCTASGQPEGWEPPES